MSMSRQWYHDITDQWLERLLSFSWFTQWPRSTLLSLPTVAGQQLANVSDQSDAIRIGKTVSISQSLCHPESESKWFSLSQCIDRSFAGQLGHLTWQLKWCWSNTFSDTDPKVASALQWGHHTEWWVGALVQWLLRQSRRWSAKGLGQFLKILNMFPHWPHLLLQWQSIVSCQ